MDIENNFSELEETITKTLEANFELTNSVLKIKKTVDDLLEKMNKLFVVKENPDSGEKEFFMRPGAGSEIEGRP